MSETEKPNTVIVTPPFRVSFPSVFTPKPGMNGGKPKYSLSMLFPKKFDNAIDQAQFGKMVALVNQALIGKWGADKAKWPKGLYTPFRDGAEKDYDGYDDTIIFATASSTRQPGLVGPDAVTKIIDASEFYAGCYARAKIDVYAFEAKDKNTGAILKRGVTFGLLHVQKYKDGVEFSKAGKVEDAFDAIAVPAGSAAETMGGEVDALGLLG